MIRFINCFRKHPELSDEDFRDYWQGAEFDELIQRVTKLTKTQRYTKSLTLKVDMGQRMMEARGLAEPYDGILEYYWENAHHLPEIYASTEGKQLAKQMTDFQSQFIDLENSSAFFTEHND